MKTFLNNWWPLLIIAAIVIWKLCRKKQQPQGVEDPQSVTLHDGTIYVVPDVCPRCGSPVDHTGGGNKSLIAKCTNKECSYSVCYPKEGQEAGECQYCGSMQHYHVVRSNADGCSIINKAVCDNPDCRSHQLLY
jgi:hypothetical protein